MILFIMQQEKNVIMEENSVIILSADISSKKVDILKSKRDDSVLINGINEYYERVLKPNNIEIFERHDNILITERGYFLAAYAEEICEIIDE